MYCRGRCGSGDSGGRTADGAAGAASGAGVTVVLRGTGDGNWRVEAGYPTP